MKFVHTSITVKNMDESVKFYRDIMGMELLRRREIPENNAEIAFLQDSQGGDTLELTWWKNKSDWTSGDELDHLAFSVPDMNEAMMRFKNAGVKIVKEPYSLQGSKTRIAFIEDPNGIWIELIEAL
ncbi:MAG: VOC family protein [Candidatus Bathyarchaeia archaeon]